MRLVVADPTLDDSDRSNAGTSFAPEFELSDPTADESKKANAVEITMAHATKIQVERMDEIRRHS
jgi:hypothetical protein